MSTPNDYTFVRYIFTAQKETNATRIEGCSSVNYTLKPDPPRKEGREELFKGVLDTCNF